MNCKKCSVELKDNAETCHICGIKQGEAFLPVITGNEQFSFFSNGNYTLKYKLNSNLEISSNGKVVGLLVHNNDDVKNNHYYDLVQNENNENVIVRFVREDKTLTCVDPISGKVFFTWHCSKLSYE